MLSRAFSLLGPSLVLLLFWPVLFGIDQLAFRDVSYFYTPLYQYIAERTATDWLPLWNPLDHTGTPLIGETSTAVLYPIRYILFSLPLSSHLAMGWYVAVHLMIASVTAFAAARWAGVRPLAATFAGIVYPLSGSVLFLYTNPPFLVGAAWLPLVLGALLATASIRDSSRVLIAGTAMALMILGGDPQTALHAGVVVGIVWLIQVLRSDGQRAGGLALIGAAALAAILSAPQLAASIDWARQSDRTGVSESRAWLDPPVVGSQRHEAFQYSVAPWHAFELATPNAFGSLFPVNSRWSRLIPGDGRMWTPSIYMGFISLFAIATTIVRWRSHRPDRWLAIAALSLLLSMGHFGLVWLIQAATPWLDQVDSSVGGLYWLLYEFLPGYDSFRYPAKWLPVFALAVAILTAQVVDRGIATRHASFLAIALIASPGFLLLLQFYPQLVAPEAARLVSDEFWGPLDLARSLRQTLASLAQTAIVIAAVVMVFQISVRRGWAEQKSMLFLLAITSFDLALSGHSQIATVSVVGQTELQTLIGAEPAPRGTRSMRTRSDAGWPRKWTRTHSLNRIEDVEASLRASRYGRWHLDDGASMLGSMVSIRSQRMAEFWNATRAATFGKSLAEQTRYWDKIRKWLAIDGVIHTTDRASDFDVGGRIATVIDVRSRYPALRTPPIRLSQQWRYQGDPYDFDERLAEIVRNVDTYVPLLESSETDIGPQRSDADASIRVLTDEPELTELVVKSATSVLVTRPVLQDGNWYAEFARVELSDAEPVHWEPTGVHPVDRITQGVVLPPGQWQLRIQYRPWWLAWSFGIAVAGWVGAIGLAARLWLEQRM